MTCICSPGRESATNEPSRSEDQMRLDPKKILEQAARYIDILRARKRKPDPLMEIAIERMQARLDEIHTTGGRFLPTPTTTPSSFDTKLTGESSRIKRRDNG